MNHGFMLRRQRRKDETTDRHCENKKEVREDKRKQTKFCAVGHKGVIEMRIKRKLLWE